MLERIIENIINDCGIYYDDIENVVNSLSNLSNYGRVECEHMLEFELGIHRIVEREINNTSLTFTKKIEDIITIYSSLFENGYLKSVISAHEVLNLEKIYLLSEYLRIEQNNHYLLDRASDIFAALVGWMPLVSLVCTGEFKESTFDPQYHMFTYNSAPDSICILLALAVLSRKYPNRQEAIINDMISSTNFITMLGECSNTIDTVEKYFLEHVTGIIREYAPKYLVVPTLMNLMV